MAVLIPELYVSDLATSLAFYQALGFRIRYHRDEERFARIARGDAELMLEEPRGRTWLLAPLSHPRGVGANLQITAENVDALFAALPSEATVVLAPETKMYERHDDAITVRQFVVADPDGYLLRFSEVMAITPIAGDERP